MDFEIFTEKIFHSHLLLLRQTGIFRWGEKGQRQLNTAVDPRPHKPLCQPFRNSEHGQTQLWTVDGG